MRAAKNQASLPDQHNFIYYILYGPRRDKTSLRVPNIATLKPVSSATETSSKIENMLVAS